MKSGRFTLVLLLLAAVLAAFAGAVHWGQLPAIAPQAGSGPGAGDGTGDDTDSAEVAEPSLPPLASLDQTIQRPLFSATRRPPEPEAREAAPAPEVAAPARETPLPATELSAVIMYGDTKVALLKNPDGGGVVRKRVGEEIGGWRLDSIDTLNVVLQNGANRHELLLRTFKSVPVRRTPSTVDKKGDGGADGQVAPDSRQGTRAGDRRQAADRARQRAAEELDPESLAELEAEDPELLDAELEAEAERVREAIERRRERRARRQ